MAPTQRPSSASELRAAWSDFFAGKGHTVVPSASLIPTHPSAPMFTNSGMMPFVSYFLGEEPVPYDPPRAVSIQKCVRAGGKHNDLDAIGRSPRHLSFFEMLGNFSFGDYFKAEAIPWAWEFLTEVLGIDGDRMWVTCHVTDDEAEEIWVDAVGVPPRADPAPRTRTTSGRWARRARAGPVSELFWDYGPELGPDGGPANPEAEHRYVEIWNLVFTQYFRGARRRADRPAAAATSTPVPVWSGSSRCSPTARRCTPPTSSRCCVDEAQSVTGHRLGRVRAVRHRAAAARRPHPHRHVPRRRRRGPLQRGPRLRAAADHPPGRALRLHAGRARPGHGRGWSSAASRSWAAAYPDLVAQDRTHRDRADRQEEERFRQTLERGSACSTPNSTACRRRDAARTVDVAFVLHDTYGFPLEVTREMAELRGARRGHRGLRGGHGRPAGAFPGRRPAHRGRGRGGGRAGTGRAGRARPDGVHRPRRGARSTRNGARRSSATRSSSTAARSTPSPAARWATPAPSPPPTGRAEGARHDLRPARPAPSHRRGARRATSSPGRRRPRRSTRSGAPRSAATTPPPTCCTGPSARCSATT